MRLQDCKDSYQEVQAQEVVGRSFGVHPVWAGLEEGTRNQVPGL